MPKLDQILIVDDEIEVGTFLSRLLVRKGFQTSYAETGADAFQLIASTGFAVAMIDLKLPDTCGLDILRQLKNNQPDCEAIIMTGYATTKTAVKAIQLGAFDYIEKPFDDISEIEQLVVKAFEYRHRITGQSGGQHEWQAIANRTGFVVGNTQKMIRLATVAEKIARKNINVLIQGETGTGKEVLARFIHAASSRSDHTFIPVNCGALPENLLESELFGHEKGAFTGATSMRRGIFEIADNGTLFLDEVGEAGLPIQVKLLRVLETGEFLRVGGEKPVQTDVRIIAATNVDLEKAVQAKNFREDLFYRLDVIRLELPPLRERKEDIPLLFNRFISRTGNLQVSPEVTRALLDYDWPGNIRELVNIANQAVALCDGNTILPSHLPDKIITRSSEQTEVLTENGKVAFSGSPVDTLEAALNAVRHGKNLTRDNIIKAYTINKQIGERLYEHMTTLGVAGPLPPSLREVEIKAIAETLSFYKGNISTAARSLGIGRNTLYRKIKEYGLLI
ncbi:sigma-54-dependent transcriptional regulator [Desulfotruncus alcoholivorax]|uniref:sigma-54-dependent transcriptional regulator n=1 Tax=Desulfotruncus alcoholivorax TaxID=265477 RepID=UPI0004100598|nr:sigma-54 dependent transcriptional regulator [Desulfotruncus alcoholivorax]